MPPTTQQWLEYHKRTLNTARCVLRGLPQEQLLWLQPGTEGETKERGCGEPRPFCIAGILKHICDAERYWLREVHIEPAFTPPTPAEWRGDVFLNVFDKIEGQYQRILADKPHSPDILFGLSRVCQHNLQHAAQAAHLRALQDRQWKGAGSYRDGSWEAAVDYLADLLIGQEPKDYAAIIEASKAK